MKWVVFLLPLFLLGASQVSQGKKIPGEATGKVADNIGLAALLDSWSRFEVPSLSQESQELYRYLFNVNSISELDLQKNNFIISLVLSAFSFVTFTLLCVLFNVKLACLFALIACLLFKMQGALWCLELVVLSSSTAFLFYRTVSANIVTLMVLLLTGGILVLSSRYLSWGGSRAPSGFVPESCSDSCYCIEQLKARVDIIDQRTSLILTKLDLLLSQR